MVTPSSNNADSFTLDDAHAAPGYGLLSNLSNFYVSGSAPSPSALPSSTVSTAADSGSKHDVTIGVGVGVPLRVIALASLTWALFERKRARAMYTQISMPMNGGVQQPPGDGGMYMMNQKGHVPAELEQRHPVAELMGRER